MKEAVMVIYIALVLSLDAFTFGVSYGVNKIRLPLKSALTIAIMGFIIAMGAMNLGEILFDYIVYGDKLGGIILIAMGIYMAADIRGGAKTILRKPETTDINRDGAIEISEAMAIGMALSLDSCGVVIGTANLGFILPVTIMIMELLFMSLGIKIGQKINLPLENKYVSLLAGIIIIVTGFKML